MLNYNFSHNFKIQFLRRTEIGGQIEGAGEGDKSNPIKQGFRALRQAVGLANPKTPEDKIKSKIVDAIENTVLAFLPGGAEGSGTSTSENWKSPEIQQCEPLLKSIRKAEGGWESISYAGPRNPKIEGLTNYTIAQVAALGGYNYAGAYQLDPNSLLEWAKGAGLKSKDKFTPENQSKIAMFLIMGRAKGKEYLAGKISKAEFGNRLANIWAGLPVLDQNAKLSNGKKRGDSYYSGIAGNKANVSPEEIEGALDQIKN